MAQGKRLRSIAPRGVVATLKLYLSVSKSRGLLQITFVDEYADIAGLLSPYPVGPG